MKYVLLIISCIGLASCKITEPKNPVYDTVPIAAPLNIYQPSILVPIKGTVIPTKEGNYQVQTDDEVWHSDKRYRTLERQIYSK